MVSDSAPVTTAPNSDGSETNSDGSESVPSSLWTLPNQLTSARLLLSFVFFGLIFAHLWIAALVVFALCGVTDWLDGFFARRLNLVGAFGRMYDPLVDKVMVLGAFIFLMEVEGTALPGQAALSAWMVVAMLARELVVTGIRGFMEERRVAFGADRYGKIKMVLQCTALSWLLVAFWLAENGVVHPTLTTIRDIFNGAAVTVTVLSGLHYLARAWPYLR